MIDDRCLICGRDHDCDIVVFYGELNGWTHSRCDEWLQVLAWREPPGWRRPKTKGKKRGYKRLKLLLKHRLSLMNVRVVEQAEDLS